MNYSPEILRDYVKSLASETVGNVMLEAELGGQHTAGSWSKEGMEHHLAHVIDHISSYMSGDRSEDHLEHAVCRMVMALWCKDNDVLGDNGDEGVNYG